MINKKISSELAVGIILIVAIVIGGIFYWQNKNNNQKIQRACTMEAKLCDDGSAVGRSGPNCEFAPCPKKSSTQIANPASVYCKQNGGELEIRTGPNGGQIGYCKFSDGSECEEWAYFRKECRNETVDWQTYKNVKYEFEFKYPTYYSIQNVKDDVITIKAPTQKGPADFHVQINQDPSLSKLDLDVIIQSKLENLSIKEQQKIIFADQVAYEGIDTGMVNEYTLLVKKGNNLFELLFNTGNKDSLVENKAALNDNQKLILSTFKFTE